MRTAVRFLMFCLLLQSASPYALAALPPKPMTENLTPSNKEPATLSLKERLQARMKKAPASGSASLIFDLPVTYNKRVSFWINHFQDKGKNWFRDWLERATKYMPFIQKELKNAGLPQDLAFMVMIESGFLPNAVSHAQAVGPWQFIASTGQHYGLRQAWWIDERRDLKKSTTAAIKYLKDLHEEFGSWYLVAASYNMGEGGLRRQMKKYDTKDFWTLAKLGALPQETTDYVPKILAAMMIAKSPSLYGFRDLSQFESLEFDTVNVPGGTDLAELANKLGITSKALRDLNAELVLGYIPNQVPYHPIRVPKGASTIVGDLVRR
jgi:membrane-bound lytic murein transglycosylase D